MAALRSVAALLVSSAALLVGATSSTEFNSTLLRAMSRKFHEFHESSIADTYLVLKNGQNIDLKGITKPQFVFLDPKCYKKDDVNISWKMSIKADTTFEFQFHIYDDKKIKDGDTITVNGHTYSYFDTLPESIGVSGSSLTVEFKSKKKCGFRNFQSLIIVKPFEQDHQNNVCEDGKCHDAVTKIRGGASIDTCNNILLTGETEVSCEKQCGKTNCPYFTIFQGECRLYGSQGTEKKRSFEETYQNIKDIELVSQGKSAFASSIHSPIYNTDKINDGDPNTFYHSTRGDQAPMVTIDLGKPYLVKKITVLPRQHDGIYQRFRNIVFYFSETDPKKVNGELPGKIHEVIGPLPTPPKSNGLDNLLTYNFKFPICGRYFTIKKASVSDESPYIEVAEVEVFAIKN